MAYLPILLAYCRYSTRAPSVPYSFVCLLILFPINSYPSYELLSIRSTHAHALYMDGRLHTNRTSQSHRLHHMSTWLEHRVATAAVRHHQNTSVRGMCRAGACVAARGTGGRAARNTSEKITAAAAPNNRIQRPRRIRSTRGHLHERTRVRCITIILYDPRFPYRRHDPTTTTIWPLYTNIFRISLSYSYEEQLYSHVAHRFFTLTVVPSEATMGYNSVGTRTGRVLYSSVIEDDIIIILLLPLLMLCQSRYIELIGCVVSLPHVLMILNNNNFETRYIMTNSYRRIIKKEIILKFVGIKFFLIQNLTDS